MKAINSNESSRWNRHGRHQFWFRDTCMRCLWQACCSRAGLFRQDFVWRTLSKIDQEESSKRVAQAVGLTKRATHYDLRCYFRWKRFRGIIRITSRHNWREARCNDNRRNCRRRHRWVPPTVTAMRYRFM